MKKNSVKTNNNLLRFWCGSFFLPCNQFIKRLHNLKHYCLLSHLPFCCHFGSKRHLVNAANEYSMCKPCKQKKKPSVMKCKRKAIDMS